MFAYLRINLQQPTSKLEAQLVSQIKDLTSHGIWIVAFNFATLNIELYRLVK